jgi:hypothetical protein
VPDVNLETGWLKSQPVFHSIHKYFLFMGKYNRIVEFGVPGKMLLGIFVTRG